MPPRSSRHSGVKASATPSPLVPRWRAQQALDQSIPRFRAELARLESLAQENRTALSDPQRHDEEIEVPFVVRRLADLRMQPAAAQDDEPELTQAEEDDELFAIPNFLREDGEPLGEPSETSQAWMRESAEAAITEILFPGKVWHGTVIRPDGSRSLLVSEPGQTIADTYTLVGQSADREFRVYKLIGDDVDISTFDDIITPSKATKMEFEEHLLHEIEAAREHELAAQERLSRLVQGAREAGITWRAIGAAAQMTHSAAHGRWSEKGKAYEVQRHAKMRQAARGELPFDEPVTRPAPARRQRAVSPTPADDPDQLGIIEDDQDLL